MEVMLGIYEKSQQSVLFNFLILIQICHILFNILPDTFIISALITSVWAFLFLQTLLIPP